MSVRGVLDVGSRGWGWLYVFILEVGLRAAVTSVGLLLIRSSGGLTFVRGGALRSVINNCRVMATDGNGSNVGT